MNWDSIGLGSHPTWTEGNLSTDEIKRLCLNIRISFLWELYIYISILLFPNSWSNISLHSVVILWYFAQGISLHQCENGPKAQQNRLDFKNLPQFPHVVAPPQQPHSNNQRTSGSRVNKWEMCWAIASSTPSCLNKASATMTESWPFNFRILETWSTHNEGPRPWYLKHSTSSTTPYLLMWS